MRFIGGCLLALMSTLIFSTRSLAEEISPGPGFSMVYAMELKSEGKVSRETLSLGFSGVTEQGYRQLELTLGAGDGALRYRADYLDRGDDPPFASSRFENLVTWDGEWFSLSPDEAELLKDLQEMAARLSGDTWDAESTFVVGGSELRCRRYSFTSSGEQTQAGESVRIRIVQAVRGEIWVCPELPFGGWVQYHEERRARKISELAGRVFQGAEEISDEMWTLKDLVFHPNKTN